jgi:tetratricopeptide (TPR) repeat protein
VCYSNLGTILYDISRYEAAGAAGRGSKHEHAAVVCISRAARLFAHAGMHVEQAAALHNLGMLRIEGLRRQQAEDPHGAEIAEAAARAVSVSSKTAPDGSANSSGGDNNTNNNTNNNNTNNNTAKTSATNANPSAQVASMIGTLEDTQTCLLQALRLRQAHLPSWSADIAETHYGLGLLCEHMRRYGDAQRHLQAAVSIAAMQSDRSRYVMFQDQLCSLQMRSGRFADLRLACAHYVRSIASRQAAPRDSELARDSAGLAQTTLLLASCRYRLFQMDAAFAAYGRVRRILGYPSVPSREPGEGLADRWVIMMGIF